MTDQELEAIGESVGLSPNISKEYGRALLARAIPEGHVVVPKEPTVEMWEEGMNCYSPDDTQGDYLEKAYRAMISAAPAPEGEA